MKVSTSPGVARNNSSFIEKFLIPFFLTVILFVCPLLFFTNLTRNPYFTQIALLNIGIALLSLSICVSSFLKSEFLFPRLAFNKPLAVILVVLVVSCSFSLMTHSFVRTGLIFEFTRVAVFTLINSIFVLFLPFFIPSFIVIDQKSKISIWSDIIFAFIWGFLWVIFHQMKDPNPQVVMWDTYGAFVWTLGFLYAFFRIKNDGMKGMFHVLFTVTLCSGSYAISQYFGRDVIWASLIQPYGGRPVSTFGNPNFLSSYLMMMSPLALVFSIESETKEKWGYFFIFLVSVVATLCTLTRSSYVGLLVSFFILFFILVDKEKLFRSKNIIFGVFVFLVLVLIFPSTPVTGVNSPIARFTEIFSAIKSGETYAPWHQRILIWSCAWDMMKTQPFLGIGWGGFELFYPFFQGKFLLTNLLAPLRTHANNAHNILLEIWAQVGMVGLGVFLWFFITLFTNGWKIFKAQENEGMTRPITAALLASMLGMVADNFAGNVSIFFAVPAFLFWWLMGIMATSSPKKSFHKLATSKPLGLIAVSTLSLISSFSAIYYFQRWQQEMAYFQGFKESKSGLVQQSIKSLETAHSWFPGEVNSNYEMGNSYSQYAKTLQEKGSNEERLKYIDKSVWAYKEAFKANPGYDEIYFNVGISEAQRANWPETIKHLEIALFINPLVKEAYGSLANAYFNLKDTKSAVRVFESAVQVFPRDKDLWNNLGYSYSQDKQTEKSFSAYKKAYEIDLSFVQAWHNMGLAAADLKKHDPALEIPKMMQMIKDLTDQQKVREALVVAEKVVGIMPESPDALLAQGNLQFYVGKKEESIKSLKQAVSLRSGFVIALTNLSQIYKALGQNDEAKKYIQEALSFAPNDPEAKTVLASFQTKS
ncbi:MAG: tetratricopeptide repeat protein [Elusimicrobiota bacterium]